MTPYTTVSIQYIKDCSKSGINNACLGGNPIYGFKDISSQGFFFTQDYKHNKYLPDNLVRPCEARTSRNLQRVQLKSIGFSNAKAETLMALLQYQPLSIAIQSVGIKDYFTGIIKDDYPSEERCTK